MWTPRFNAARDKLVHILGIKIDLFANCIKSSTNDVYAF